MAADKFGGVKKEEKEKEKEKKKKSIVDHGSTFGDHG